MSRCGGEAIGLHFVQLPFLSAFWRYTDQYTMEAIHMKVEFSEKSRQRLLNKMIGYTIRKGIPSDMYDIQIKQKPRSFHGKWSGTLHIKH